MKKGCPKYCVYCGGKLNKVFSSLKRDLFDPDNGEKIEIEVSVITCENDSFWSKHESICKQFVNGEEIGWGFPYKYSPDDFDISRTFDKYMSKKF